MKILVSLDVRIVRRLDEEAAERRLSRSALLAEFAREGLGRRRGPGAASEVRQAVEDARRIVREAAEANPWPATDSTDLIREMRDTR